MTRLLYPAQIDELRRVAARDHQSLPEAIDGAFSLTAAFELASSAHAGDLGLASACDGWAKSHATLRGALAALRGNPPKVGATFGAPSAEIRMAPVDGDEMASLLWTEHRDRFARSLSSIAGVPGPTARAITGAYAEMVDNVLCHAAPVGAPRPPSIVGFSVSVTEFEFAVADLGRGVLASLRDKEANRSLTNHGDALRAAVEEGATSRPYSTGGGFKEVHVALADLAGMLRFRTGDAALSLNGQGQTRRAVRAPSPMLSGFQLGVYCTVPRRA